MTEYPFVIEVLEDEIRARYMRYGMIENTYPEEWIPDGSYVVTGEFDNYIVLAVGTEKTAPSSKHRYLVTKEHWERFINGDWWLDAHIPVGGHSLAETDVDFWNTLNEFVYSTFGSKCDSGTGFGMRDYNYQVESKEAAEFLKARMQKELGKKFGDDLVQMSVFKIRRY